MASSNSLNDLFGEFKIGLLGLVVKELTSFKNKIQEGGIGAVKGLTPEQAYISGVGDAIEIVNIAIRALRGRINAVKGNDNGTET